MFLTEKLYTHQAGERLQIHTRQSKFSLAVASVMSPLCLNERSWREDVPFDSFNQIQPPEVDRIRPKYPEVVIFKYKSIYGIFNTYLNRYFSLMLFVICKFDIYFNIFVYN